MKSLVINALGNEVRLKLLCCLSQGQKNVQELIEKCGLSQSAVSQHLTKLKQAGLVHDKKEGKFVYYTLTHRTSAVLALQLLELIKEIEKDTEGSTDNRDHI